MQAVLLAAGAGSRLRSASDCKPLTPLLGLTLLERNLRLAHQAGVKQFIVITGYQHDRVEAWCDDFSQRTGWPVTVRYNPDWDSTENGKSLQHAAGLITGRFLLLMADHVYSAPLLERLVHTEPPVHGVVLAVDGNITRSDIDLDDVTRVSRDGERIHAIGKHLEPFDGFDTGAFLCEPQILMDLESVIGQGDTGLSDLMRVLAQQGRFVACPVDGEYWQDVDTARDLVLAHRSVLLAATQKPRDGPVARYLNRPFSRRMTSRLVSTSITPNQISWIVLLVTIGAAGLLAQTAWWWMVLGGLLVQFASVLDGCDGEVARLRIQESEYGGWLDAQLDRYGDAAVIGALTYNAMTVYGGYTVFWLGLAALTGSFMVSYSAHKTDQLLREPVRIGRDLRLLIVAVGAILSMPLATLWVLAIVMNMAVFSRLMRMRRVLL